MAPKVSKAFLLAVVFHAIRTTTQPIARSESLSDAKALIAELKLEPTRYDRFHDILTSDGQTLLTGQELADATIFDFNAAFPVPGGEGGTVSTASLENLPILLDSGLTTSISTLGPCGIFFPHVHPRANEFFTVIEGELGFGYMLEGPVLLDPNVEPRLPAISGTLTKFTGTLFPQGSIHFQINHQCEPATIVATLSSDDPGTTAVLQQVGTEEMRMVKGKRQADIGDIEMYFPVLPPVLVEAAKECLARCA